MVKKSTLSCLYGTSKNKVTRKECEATDHNKLEGQEQTVWKSAL